jgi:hypothetical protein
MFNIKNLNKVAGKEKYCVKVSNRSAALEDLDAEVDISIALERIRENLKLLAKESLGYCKLKKQRPWLQDQGKINGVNLRNVRREASMHFTN